MLQAVVLKNVAEKGFDQMIEDAADAVSASPNPLASEPLPSGSKIVGCAQELVSPVPAVESPVALTREQKLEQEMARMKAALRTPPKPKPPQLPSKPQPQQPQTREQKLAAEMVRLIYIDTL